MKMLDRIGRSARRGFGEFLYSLPIVMTCALVASRLASMTFIPLLGYYILRPGTRRNRNAKAWEHWLPVRLLHLRPQAISA